MPVIFEDTETPSRKPLAKRQGFSSSEFLIKNGFVKTEKGAHILLLLIAVALIGLFIYSVNANRVTIEPPSPEEYLVQ